MLHSNDYSYLTQLSFGRKRKKKTLNNTTIRPPFVQYQKLKQTKQNYIGKSVNLRIMHEIRKVRMEGKPYFHIYIYKKNPDIAFSKLWR